MPGTRVETTRTMSLPDPSNRLTTSTVSPMVMPAPNAVGSPCAGGSPKVSPGHPEPGQRGRGEGCALAHRVRVVEDEEEVDLLRLRRQRCQGEQRLVGLAREHERHPQGARRPRAADHDERTVEGREQVRALAPNVRGAPAASTATTPGTTSPATSTTSLPSPAMTRAPRRPRSTGRRRCRRPPSVDLDHLDAAEHHRQAGAEDGDVSDDEVVGELGGDRHACRSRRRRRSRPARSPCRAPRCQSGAASGAGSSRSERHDAGRRP